MKSNNNWGAIMTKVIVCDQCKREITFRGDLSVILELPNIKHYHRECYKSQKVKIPRFFKNQIQINTFLINLFSFLYPILFILVFYMSEVIDQLAHTIVLLSLLTIRAVSYFKIERHIKK
ncbi:MAG: hypothetical protein K0R18_1357 [Bacillales bacterium]|jgi:hypothetical protein|nr:hypothetical protein [Bacillales bacterium]